MTQTPASGPLAPVTTPPMSSLSIATAAPPACPATICRPDIARATARPTARLNATDKIFFVVISQLPLLNEPAAVFYTRYIHPARLLGQLCHADRGPGEW